MLQKYALPLLLLLALNAHVNTRASAYAFPLRLSSGMGLLKTKVVSPDQSGNESETDYAAFGGSASSSSVDHEFESDPGLGGSIHDVEDDRARQLPRGPAPRPLPWA